MTYDVVAAHVVAALPIFLTATDTFWRFLGEMSTVMSLGLAALGSAIGIGIAGQAAAGAWAKERVPDATLTSPISSWSECRLAKRFMP